MRHKHVWECSDWRAGACTTGVSGYGRTIAHRRQCKTCGRAERRENYDPTGGGWRSRWVRVAAAKASS